MADEFSRGICEGNGLLEKVVAEIFDRKYPTPK